MTENQSQNVFINGKAQMIEMFQHLSSAEKERLIKNIRLKNPSLAEELSSKSFSFSDIGNLHEDAIRQSLQFINAQILGLALKLTTIEFQRKILRLAPRGYAETAFKTLTSHIQNPARDSKRAQEKIISTINDLIRNKVITLD